MADKNEAPRRSASEAKPGTAENSPFSIPLEKGGDILAEPSAPKEGASSKAAGETKREGVLAEHAPPDKVKRPADYRGGISMWKLLVAMFLFPFFFNLGSELYLMARTAITAYLGGAKPAAEPQTQPPMANGEYNKVIESLALVIANQEKLLRDTEQRVVIIHPDYTGEFSYDEEKGKVKELAGIDLDDPVTGSDKIAKIRSSEILSAVIRSFDRILLNAAQNNLSEFRIKNTMEAKKQALKRLQELR